MAKIIPLRDPTNYRRVLYGSVTDHSQTHQLWRYVVDGRSVDETPMRCVVEINGRLIIVTVVDRS